MIDARADQPKGFPQLSEENVERPMKPFGMKKRAANEIDSGILFLVEGTETVGRVFMRMIEGKWSER